MSQCRASRKLANGSFNYCIHDDGQGHEDEHVDRLGVKWTDDLDIGCGFHNMPLLECTCPKGDGAWLEYRRLWKEARDQRDAAKAALLHIVSCVDTLDEAAGRMRSNSEVLRAARDTASMARSIAKKALDGEAEGKER